MSLPKTSLPEAARAAIIEAMRVLEPHETSDARVAGLVRPLREMARSHDQELGDESEATQRMIASVNDTEGEIAKSMIEADRLAKSETASPEVRRRARKAYDRLALIQLHNSNPRAAREWADLHV